MPESMEGLKIDAAAFTAVAYGVNVFLPVGNCMH
jgi:hypothetical protein